MFLCVKARGFSAQEKYWPFFQFKIQIKHIKLWDDLCYNTRRMSLCSHKFGKASLKCSYVPFKLKYSYGTKIRGANAKYIKSCTILVFLFMKILSRS